MFVYIPQDLFNVGKKPHSLQTVEDEIESVVIKLRVDQAGRDCRPSGEEG